jgi:hypothetical protein
VIDRLFFKVWRFQGLIHLRLDFRGEEKSGIDIATLPEHQVDPRQGTPMSILKKMLLDRLA